MSTIICLKGSIEALPIIQRVKALGRRVVLVDADDACVCRPLADIFVHADHYNVADTMHGLQLAMGSKPDAVLCCGGDTPHVAAVIAYEYKLPGLIPIQAALSIDKLAQKTALRAAGLPVPDFRAWESVVVKPQASRGARGVKLIETGGMVERYLPGPQLSTESIVQDGRVLFTGIALRNYDRLAEFAPHIIEDGFDEPWGNSYLYGKVDTLIKSACRALDWYQHGGGTVKADLILNDDEIVILELAARLSGGFLATHGHPLAYGVPFVDYAITAALGKPIYLVTPILSRTHYVCQRYVFPEPDDIGRQVKSIFPSLYLATHTGALEYWSWNIKSGDRLQPVISHNQRWGQAICTGATPEQARARAETAVAAMKQAVILE